MCLAGGGGHLGSSQSRGCVEHRLAGPFGVRFGWADAVFEYLATMFYANPCLLALHPSAPGKSCIRRGASSADVRAWHDMLLC